MSSLVASYGLEEAKKLWDFIEVGVHLIHKNIQDFNIVCDYQEQDTLVVATSTRDFTNDIVVEHEYRQKLGYKTTLYTEEQLKTIIASQGYQGGVAYPDTFGIQAYGYCARMKEVLVQSGVRVYEEAPAIALEDHVVTTKYGQVRAEHIVVCTDHCALTEVMRKNSYHVQTFLMASSPLSQQQIHKIFPEKRYMVWDTDTIYNYYRVTGDNRLLLGGARLLDTYASSAHHNNRTVAQKLIRYFNTKFPGVDAQFEYMWPGLIGVSKDLFPLAGPDKAMPSVYYVSAATGLPWAAALGNYSARHIIDGVRDLDEKFSPYRKFSLGPVTQAVLGKPLTFAISNFLSAGSI